jgi:type IV pilus assembly protein PilC
MPLYLYTAKDEKGQTQAGRQQSINKHKLADFLRSQGLVLISAEASDLEDDAENGFKQKILALWQKISNVSLVEKMMFSRHLSVMIEAGLSLSQSLKVLAEQSKSPKFKKIIGQVEKSVRRGESFSNSLSKHPKVFNELYVNMIKAGEKSGNLNEVLRILAEQMRKDYELISRVRGAMMYPAVIVTAMIGIGILMMVMVVPKLTSVFDELNIDLPLSTQIIIGVSNFLKNNILLGIIILVLIFVLLRFLFKIKLIKKVLNKAYLKLPIFGSLVRKVNSARFARTFGSLMESGVGIVESLKIVSGTLGNLCFKEILIDSAEQVQKGTSLSQILTKYKEIYPPMVVQMIAVGEETGSLAEILQNMADFYEEEVDNITENLSSVIEPIIMVIIGVAVGFFAISMIQPMYSMMEGI